MPGKLVPFGRYDPDDPGDMADLAIAELRVAFRAAGLNVPEMAADNDPRAFGAVMTCHVEISALPWEAAREVARLLLAGVQHEADCPSTTTR